MGDANERQSNIMERIDQRPVFTQGRIDDNAVDANASDPLGVTLLRGFHGVNVNRLDHQMVTELPAFIEGANQEFVEIAIARIVVEKAD